MGDLLDRLSFKRPIRVSIWNPNPSMVNAGLAFFEAELKKIFIVEFTKVSSLEDKNLVPCDLLVCFANFIEDDIFETWIKGVENRIPCQGSIQIPAVLLTNLNADIQRNIMKWGLSVNWYFDLIHLDQLLTLPVRVTNLLRFHDHLHEVNRMHQTVVNLSSQVQALEASLQSKQK